MLRCITPLTATPRILGWIRPATASNGTHVRWRSSERQILLNETENGVVTMVLNRPKANAMGAEMLEELGRTMDGLESTNSSARCLVVTSFSDRVFSAGADLKERAKMTVPEAEAFVSRLRMTMDRVSRLPIPVIASMEGVAVGGGLELALAADLRVAGENSKMGLPETSLAIVPGAGGTQRLPRLIGTARAKELIFTARTLDAQTALEYGIVQHVVPAGEALNKATE